MLNRSLFAFAPFALLPLLAACTSQTTTTTPAPGEPAAETPAPADPEENPAQAPDKPAAAPAEPPKVTLDGTFGGVADPTNELDAAVPAPDGKIYVSFRKAGGAIGWGSGTLVRRYLATGALDTSFATGGTLTTTLVANPDAIAVDGSGRVLVGGTGLYDPDTTSDTGREIVVLRIGVDGAVDKTYGAGGRAILNFSPANTFTTNLVVRADGGAFVSVYGRTNGKDAFGSFLVDGKGAPVTGYGPGGFQASDGPTDAAFAVGNDVILPGGDGLVRYGENGNTGAPLLTVPAAWAKRGADGAVVAVVASKKTAGGFDLVRYTPAGARDTAFGAVTVDDSLRDVAFLKDGSLLLTDAKGLSWIPKTGGTATVVASDATVDRLFLGADGKLLTVRKGQVLRYVLL